MFDVSITKAEYVQNKSLVLDLEFTKIKEGVSYPEITFINGSANTNISTGKSLSKLDDLKVGQKRKETITENLIPGVYKLQIFDAAVSEGTKTVVYGDKVFKIEYALLPPPVPFSEVTTLKGPIIVSGGLPDRVFDISVTSATYNEAGILILDLDLIKKKNSTNSKLSIKAEKKVLMGSAPSIFYDIATLDLGSYSLNEKIKETVSIKIPAGEYIFVVSDTGNDNVLYQQKKFVLETVSKPVDKQSKNNGISIPELIKKYEPGTARTNDRIFDVEVKSATYDKNDTLYLDLEFTGVKISKTAKPDYLIIQVGGSGADSPKKIPTFDFKQVGEKKYQKVSTVLSPGKYLLTFSDSATGVTYAPQPFTLVGNNSEDSPKDDVLDKGNPEELLAQNEKFSNPFKNLGSFEKITSAVLTGIVIPVGLPVLAIFIMYTGFLFVKARGNPAELVNAKKAAKWTAIGGFIMIGALTIVQFIQATFNNITGM
jgi:hypothetical protein